MVYTDIRMPGMDGLDLVETMKARRPWTPVVIVTAFGIFDKRPIRIGSITESRLLPVSKESQSPAARPHTAPRRVPQWADRQPPAVRCAALQAGANCSRRLTTPPIMIRAGGFTRCNRASEGRVATVPATVR